MCDRVIIINKGDIRAIDTIENLEKSFNATLSLHIKIKGAKSKAASIIETADGIKEIVSIDDEGNDIWSFEVLLDGNAEDIRNNLMTELVKNKVSIMEIYADKPNLENVFIELINRPVKKTSLMDLVDEIVPETSENSSDEDDSSEKEEE